MTLSAKNILSATFAGLAIAFATLPASAQTAAMTGNVPLYFEAGSSARFLARGRDAQFLISPTGAQLALQKSGSVRAVQMQFVGANPQAGISGDAEFSGKINYLTGNDPAQWRSGIPTFARVRVEQIYSGVDLIYYGNQRQLEYDFTIAAGADPNAIAIHFDGADRISVNARGELVLGLGNDEIRQPKPLIYQTVRGAQKQIDGGYKILDAHTVTFAVGGYDRALPLVIDPILSYSTYFGGTSGETAWAVALNPNDGSIYIAGQTFSKFAFTNGPVFSTQGAFQTNFAGGKYTGDAFVAKFDSLGTNLLYLTYLGGSGDDGAYGVAVNGAGDAFIGGFTGSTNFPVRNAIPGHANISGQLDKNIGLYPSDVFVAELDAGGSNLIYSTYLGGEGADAAYGIAVDSSDNAYITGFTFSTNFPVENALQDHLACTNSFYFNANAFVAEITNGGGALVFSTYLGGTNYDTGKGIAVDSSGIYVTGFTKSTNFPTANFISQSITNLFRTNSYNGNLLNGSTNKFNSASDAFVTKLAPGGGGFIYSTYLGGTNNDAANSIAVDGSGAAYVTGWTISTNFPDTVGTDVIANYLTNNVRSLLTTNAFLTKITNGTPAGIAYSVVFGGKKSDVGNGVAIDPAGNAFVIGTTSSTNFPVYNSLGFLRATNSGKSDVFVTAFNTNASALFYSVLLGGKTADFGYSIAVDSSDNAYVVGQTTSTNFPATTLSTNFPINGAEQPERNGTNDTFLAIISPAQFQPSLSIIPVPTNRITLAWLEPGTSTFKLESNTNLVTTNWVTLTNLPALSNDWHAITLPSTNDARFFRLHN